MSANIGGSGIVAQVPARKRVPIIFMIISIFLVIVAGAWFAVQPNQAQAESKSLGAICDTVVWQQYIDRDTNGDARFMILQLAVPALSLTRRLNPKTPPNTWGLFLLDKVQFASIVKTEQKPASSRSAPRTTKEPG